MDAALGWIGEIVRGLLRFFPRVEIVDTTQAGVKFVKGKHVKPFGPGLLVYWPLVTELKFYPTARQPLNLPSQTLQTKDGKTVAVGGAVEYRVPDPTFLLTEVLDPDQTIRLIAAGAFHKVITGLSYEELSGAPKRALTLLRLELRERLSHLGVRVVSVKLTDFAPTRVYKLIQSTSAD
jgi:regulator of protease activity HflC (stomatin/prohibitin superfamily)